MAVAQVRYNTVTIPNGITISYREAGESSSPTILLLHGFPSSSYYYRDLIPLLSHKYHVLAPDFPGFGFTTVPASAGFKYTFANITSSVASFVDSLSIKTFAVYIFDYGAPVGLRLALERPDAVTAIVSQNGNAYTDGLSAFWDLLRAYWASSGAEEVEYRAKMTSVMLTLEQIKSKYITGTPAAHLDRIAPECYWLDYSLIKINANLDIQLDMLKDYGTNVELYPDFQKYFRDSQVPLLAIWGKNDRSFIPPGAEAFKRDLPKATVELLDAGHFAVETNAVEIAEKMLEFLQNNGI